MPGKHYINSGSLNATQVCPNPNVHLQALFSSVFLQRKIMLCSENTTEIGFQVVPHSSHHGMSHQLGFQHWKVCCKAHLSPIYRNWKNLTLYQHLGSSESVKFFPQLSFWDGNTGVFYLLPTHRSNPLSSASTQTLPNIFCDFSLQSKFLNQREKAPLCCPITMKARCELYPHKQNLFQIKYISSLWLLKNLDFCPIISKIMLLLFYMIYKQICHAFCFYKK